MTDAERAARAIGALKEIEAIAPPCHDEANEINKTRPHDWRHKLRDAQTKARVALKDIGEGKP